MPVARLGNKGFVYTTGRVVGIDLDKILSLQCERSDYAYGGPKDKADVRVGSQQVVGYGNNELRLGELTSDELTQLLADTPWTVALKGFWD